MDPFTISFSSKLAATLAAGAITSSGRSLREKLKTPEREKALTRCCRAALEALVREGVSERTGRDNDGLRQHVQSVIEEFCRYSAPQDALSKVLRGKKADPEDLADLFAEECEPDKLPQLELVRGFQAFLDAFVGQVMEEEALREVLRIGFEQRRTEAQEDLPRAVREQPEIAETARRAAARKDRLEEAETAERTYLHRMRKEWQLLPLVVLGGDRGPDEPVMLDDVYVELDTTHRVKVEGEGEDGQDEPVAGEAVASEMLGRGAGRGENLRPLSAREAAAQHQRLVLLGDPGSGKSTFVQELLARCASARLGEGELPKGFDKSRLPVLILLRDLSRRLLGLDLSQLTQRERERKLAEAVRGEALAGLTRYGLNAFAEGLGEAWEAGGCLVALDGLDEVPPDQRALVREAVLAASRENGGPGRILVTCRVRSYRGDAEMKDFSAFTLAPFDEDKIRRFSLGWYRAQSADETAAEERGEELARAALAPALRELAENPMLLTTMALIHQRNVGLPRERVRLYDEAVKLLLVRWQKDKPGTEGLEDLLRDERRLRRVLERLAFEAHRVGGTEREKAAGLARGEILTLLDGPEYLKGTGTVSRFLDYVDRRAGLLVGRGGSEGRPESYSFPHRTFQEYLAGCHLVGQRDVVREYFSRAAEGDLWSVAAEMGAEALLFVRDNRNGLLDLAYGLCPADAPASEREQRALLWSGKAAALVGRGEIERDAEAPHPQGGKSYLKRLIPRLLGLLRSDLPSVERAEAGRVLARLEDPRREVTTCLEMGMCAVPAGDFWWGGDYDYLESEKTPWEQRSVAYPYWISRYPVTQAHYAEFARAGGYREERFWPEAREAGVWEPGKITDIWSSVSVDGPREYGEVFSLPNHPVVGVTWYEALAFTRWLTERLRGREGWEGWGVRLPSETEWEKAARGGLVLPAEHPPQPLQAVAGTASGPAGDDLATIENAKPKRVFPWGDEISTEHANYDDTGIGATSAVGCFVQGASPYGCDEMSGNVWEWCRDVRRGQASDRNADVALRGGSWAYPALYLAAAFRLGVRAGHRNQDIGFRVGLSSVSEHT